MSKKRRKSSRFAFLHKKLWKLPVWAWLAILVVCLIAGTSTEDGKDDPIIPSNQTNPTIVPTAENQTNLTIAPTAEIQTNPTIMDFSTENGTLSGLSSSSALSEASNDSLEQFLYTITPETKLSLLEDRAEEYGLFVNSRLNGIGGEEFRFALTEDVAKNYKSTYGSVIVATCEGFDGDLKSVEYFSESKMLSAFWFPRDGYSMIDYNDPAHYSARVSIESFSALQGYEPAVIIDDNALESLFLQVSDHMTIDEVMQYVEDNGLTYNSRGVGNEQYIVYDYNVRDKFGDNGTYLVIDFSSGSVSRLEYYDYVTEYWNSCHAAFFSQGYPYNDLDGFYIMRSKDDVTEMEDARAAIDMIKTLRYEAQRSLGYAE